MNNLARPKPGHMAAVSAGHAGFWIRVLAQLIDGAVLALVGGILTELSFHPRVLDLADTGPSALLSLLYFGLFWSKMGGGQTVGMRFMGLKIVGIDGQPIGLGTAVIRWFGLMVSLSVLFLGVIWIAFDPQKQGWHDKIASTYVVTVGSVEGVDQYRQKAVS
jgi:uncharacterized RDD family membrane protein YckC